MKTVNGKSMPVDLKPDPTGNIVILEGVAHVVAPDAIAAMSPEQRGAVLRTSHFATCAYANEFRKATKEKEAKNGKNYD